MYLKVTKDQVSKVGKKSCLFHLILCSKQITHDGSSRLTLTPADKTPISDPLLIAYQIRVSSRTRNFTDSVILKILPYLS